METLQAVREMGMDLDLALDEAGDSKEKRRRLITDYLSNVDLENQAFELPAVDATWQWFNVARPLTEDHFMGRITVLDFFTYCCINCMHILPDLEALEQSFPADRVLVVGVHSAKFENERDGRNVANAVKRYGIKHPVVNDKELRWWNGLGITCWPTLLVLDPRGRPIREFTGEGHRAALLEFVAAAADVYEKEGLMAPSTPLPAALEVGQEPSLLHYPGKVACGGEDSVFVADSGNHRVLVVNKSGVVRHVVGTGRRGFADGDFARAAFSSPQGVCFLPPSSLVVADTENHAVRRVDLDTRRVTTLCGIPGVQGNDLVGGKPGLEQVISSPWDVTLGPSPSMLKAGGQDHDTVYIAMAGTHQIWAYCLKDSVWWKGLSARAGTCLRIAGSGREENRNNSYPDKAGFAQPSGLALAPALNALFVADSESSSVRQVNIADGSVRGVCGGSRDPTDLFAFGDADGIGSAARLQHPLAVAWNAATETLLVADSYNHKIREVTRLQTELREVSGLNNKQSTVTTFLSDGKLDEPGGLAVCGPTLYIADTNNSRIVAVNLDSKKSEVFEVELPGDQLDSSPPKKHQPAADIVLERECSLFSDGGSLSLSVNVLMRDPVQMTESAPHSWELQLPPGFECSASLKGKFPLPSSFRLTYPATSGLTDLPVVVRLYLKLYLCNKESGVCYPKLVEAVVKCSEDKDASQVQMVEIQCLVN